MKAAYLTSCLFFAGSNAFAAHCSVTPAGQPCTPDPGKETDEAKQEILNLIALAKKSDPVVMRLEAKYRAVRDNPNATDQEKFAACEPYYKKKSAQYELYTEAMNKTSELYHVQPDDTGVVIIGKPKDPAIGYTTGRATIWEPEVTDSGPGVKLAIKVQGNDGKSHYSGAVSMDPAMTDGYQGLTLEDGRVLILKGVLNIALQNKNPGIIASVLYHESQHFNRLSRPAANGKGPSRSWDSPEEEEWDAYVSNIAYAKTFGLSKKDIDGLKGHRDRFAQAINNKRLSSRAVDPHQEKIWKLYYETKQINLDEEYSTLKAAVEKARTTQKAIPQKGPWGEPGEFARKLAELKNSDPAPQPARPAPQAPAAAKHTPDSPFVKTLPQLQAFAAAACRAPASASPPDLNLDAPFYASLRGSGTQDERAVQYYAMGMSGCAKSLYFRLIAMVRDGSYGQVGNPGWIANAVAGYSPPPSETSGGNTGRSEGGGGQNTAPPRSSPPQGCIPGDSSRRNCIACGNTYCD